MSTRPGQRVPVIPRMCEHLVADAHFDQPFSLLALDHDVVFYLCPRCLADEVEGLADVLPPSEIGAAISFAHCDHVTGHCHRCEVAGTAALAQRWADLAFTKPTTANRLSKLLRHLGHRFNRAGLRAIDSAQDSPAPASTVYSPRMLRSESPQGDWARAAQRSEQDKMLRRQTLKPPARFVQVVPPARKATPRTAA